MTVSESERSSVIATAQFSPEVPGIDDFVFAGWNTAEPIRLALYWSGAAAPSGRQAEVRIIWSRDGINLRYNCAQEEPLVVAASPQTSKKTIGLWERDVCEFFVAPDPEALNHYFEFEAAPTGEWLDVGITHTESERQSDWDFNSGMAVATKIVGSALLISMHIPWSSQIPRPGGGAQWRANFFRCIGTGEGRGYLAWRPTLTPEPNFHVPECFGWLRFAG